MGTCTCPVGTAIPTITPSTCPFEIKQVQKLIWTRKGNTIASLATAKLEATWTALLAAAAGTRAQVTPFVWDAVITAGDAVEEGGGDNSTLNGIPVVEDVSPTQFTGYFRNQNQQAVIKVLREFKCEDLEAYMINRDGYIVGRYTDAGTTIQGFPITALHIGDMHSEGFSQPTKNMMSFYMEDGEGWSDELIIIETAFNALELAN